MKILVIGDLHGRKPRIKIKNFDAIISVGDVCDDSEIGLLYQKYFEFLKNKKDELPNFEEWIYSKVGGKNKLKKIEKRSLQRGRKILEYLNSFNKPIFIVPGNWDQSFGKTKIKNQNKNYYTYEKVYLDNLLGDRINTFLARGLKNIRDCQYRTYEFSNLNFIGYGLSNNKEYFSKVIKRRKKEKLKPEEITKLKKAYIKIIKKLDDAYNKGNKKLPVIFVSHNTPYKTKLDIIKNKKSYAYGKHLGSSISRQFCIRYKPLLCICGHIHEGKGRDKIGKTIIINPGFGENAQVLIQIDEEKERIKSIKFL